MNHRRASTLQSVCTLNITATLVAVLLGINTCGNAEQDEDGDCYCRDAQLCTSSSNPECSEVLPGDCNDKDVQTHPDAAELCDGKDNNCDGSVSENLKSGWYVDQDRDNFGSAPALECSGDAVIASRGDCNDGDSNIHPGAADATGDGIDQDCGGTTSADPHVGLTTSSLATIQSALDAATDGMTIWVGPKTYTEANLSFKGKAVSLRSTHLAEQTTVDAQQSGRVFIFNTKETSSSVLDGFTVTGGTSTGSGGGIYLVSTSPSIYGCIITGNTAQEGAGLYAHYSQSVISGCEVRENTAKENGGGLYLYQSTISLLDSTISNNVSSWYTSGGVMISSSDSVFENVRIFGNKAPSAAGMYMHYSSPVLNNCTIQGNTATSWAGGMLVYWSAPQVTNTLIEGNTASVAGGVYLTAGDPYGEQPVFEQMVMVNNTATTSGTGGGFHLQDYWIAPLIQNSIIAYNAGYNVYSVDAAVIEGPELYYTDLYNPNGELNHNLAELDATNLTVEPGFLSYTAEGKPNGFHLSPSSALINAGYPDVYDPDLSAADLGIYGGAKADEWDLDADGLPEYFWPGSRDYPPPGYYSVDYDCNDLDPAIQFCQ